MASDATQHPAGDRSTLAPEAWLGRELHTVVEELASFVRPSASEGERRAAEWIAARMRQHGHPATVEVERAHGASWWPLDLLNGAVALAGTAARRSRSGRVRMLCAA